MTQRWKAFRLKFLFRLFALIDVLFMNRFELQVFRKDGTTRSKTRFSAKEINEARKNNKL